MCNSHRALCTRHAVERPTPTRNFDNVRTWFQTAMNAAACDYYQHEMIDFAVWLAKWPLCKQLQIMQSIAAGDKLRPDLVQGQVKRECLSSRPTKPRLIQFYFNMRTQAEFGPRFYALQKAMTSRLRNFTMGCTDITFGSGMNATEIGAWMSNCVARGATSYYERDGKCWDATMGPIHSGFRCELYGIIDRDLAEFAGNCVHVTGIVRAGKTLETMIYSVKGTVKSGHNDTTLGNSLINAAIACDAFNRANVRCSIIVAGDDLLVACYDRFNLKDMIDAEAALGIKPEAREFSNPCDVSFISGIFAPDGDRFHFIPKPGKLLAKLFWTVNPPGEKKLAEYQRGVVRGLLPSCHGVPIVREFLHAFDGPGRGMYNSRGYVYHHSNIEPVFPFDQWFCDRYGVSQSQLRGCERYLRAAPVGCYLLVHPVLERIIAVDLADIDDRETVWADSAWC